MILSPGPSTPAHFAGAEPLPGESIMPPLRGPADSPATLRGFGSYRLRHPSASSLPAQEERWPPSLISGDGPQPSTSRPASSATPPPSCAHHAAGPVTGPAPSRASTSTRTTSTQGGQHDRRSHVRSPDRTGAPPTGREQEYCQGAVDSKPPTASGRERRLRRLRPAHPERLRAAASRAAMSRRWRR
jgi:hypothetical protein